MRGFRIRLFEKGDFIMLPTYIAIAVIAAVIVLWAISTQRKLVIKP